MLVVSLALVLVTLLLVGGAIASLVLFSGLVADIAAVLDRHDADRSPRREPPRGACRL
ncbi:MAG: hypothetical protein ACFBWO_13340 [Paracoccaceae bacterium]